jgi:hypothetical protein
MKCKKDGGLCGVGGYCDKCPARGNDMSITIEEVLTEFKTFIRYHMEDLGNTYYESPIKCEDLKLLVDELETLRAQLMNCSAALLELCRLKAYKDTLGKTEEYLKDQPIAWATANALLASLPTTTQDVIAKVRNDVRAEAAAWEKLYQGIESASEERYLFLEECHREAEKWRSEGDMYGWNFHQGMVAGANWSDLFYQRVIRALKTEVK